MQHADVIVIGLGAMGAAVTCQLAARGVHVIGIDRHAPPHPFGSTHGDTRVTRHATAEGAAYVPFAMRSHELWRELEHATSTDILTECGVLMIGPPAAGGSMHGIDDWIAATAELATRFDIPHELLDGAQVRERYPLFRAPLHARAYLEPGGGFVRPEAAVTAQLALASRHGAVIRTHEQVLDIASAASGVEVATSAGRLAAGHVVLAAGAWAPEFLADSSLRDLLRVHRQELHWFDVDSRHADLVAPVQCPVFMWSFGTDPDEHFYGFPAIDGAAGGIKVASERWNELVTADTVDREVATGAAEAMFDHALRDRFLGVRRAPLRSVSCLYTVTPDSHFVIDAHPQLDHVTIVSPCSGHGFKHSAAIGEAIAETILDGRSRLDLNPFALARFDNHVSWCRS